MKDKAECSIQRLVTIVERLRGPDGCPWDIAQTTSSLRPYLLEECHEFLVALDHANNDDIRDELGDLLLQIVLNARIFEEKGVFDLTDAANSISDKLIRRHPHVFAKQPEHETTDLDLQWETIKRDEKAASGKTPTMFEQIDSDLPPLLAARKISEKAARIGLDWPDSQAVINKVREELDELEAAITTGNDDNITHELGDLVFSIVNLARHLNIDTGLALRQNLVRFTGRVQQIERILQEDGRTFNDVDFSELDLLWNQVKLNEQNKKRT